MASASIVQSMQSTISSTRERIVELQEHIEQSEELAKELLKQASDLVEEAKIYKSQLRNEKILLAETVTTLSTLLIDPPKAPATIAEGMRTEKDLIAELTSSLG